MNDNAYKIGYQIGAVIGTGFVLAIGAAGLYTAGKCWKNYCAERDAKQIAEEKQIWNNGKCPKCSRKWHAHAYYPPYSRGEYQYVDIKCKNCKTKAVLELYKPITTDEDYTIIN